MTIETFTERGVLSKANCVTLTDGVNTCCYNLAQGIVVSGTKTTLTLDQTGNFTGKIIEIINGAGIDQIRYISAVNSFTITISPPWGWIPDSSSKYVIHQNSSLLPTQSQVNLSSNILLPTFESSIDDFYRGCYIKITDCVGKGTIYEITKYDGTSKLLSISPRPKTYTNSKAMYMIYGESGLATNGTHNTITFDGNQSSIVDALQYIEIINGTGQGQIRMISGISSNIATVSSDWTIIPDNTSRYTIFSGWGASSYENILRHAVVTIASSMDIDSGERSSIILESSMDTTGSNIIKNITELSASVPSNVHAVTVISQFFRIKFVSMGTTLNGTVQTILNSYKSGKIASKVEEIVHGHSDCDLTRSIITGKTSSGEYKNVQTDNEGNICSTIRNPIDGFGSLVVVQPRQIAELMFLNNIVNPTAVVTHLLNSGQVYAQNNICTISTGTNANGYATMFSVKRMRYTPGLSVYIRFTAMFSLPTTNSTQLIGYGDVCNGVFVGYNGLNFGIMRRYGGAQEIRKITVTGTSSQNDTVVITLDGTAYNINILASDNTCQIARKIANTVFTGWTTYEEGASVIIVSYKATTYGGTFSYSAANGSTGTITQIQSGANPTETWTLQSDWSIDAGLGIHTLPFINHQSGNVYEISLQWLGFGNITFRVENPETGTFSNIHQIRYCNQNTLVSLQNPNLALYAHVEKNSGDSSIVTVQTASMGMYIMGDNNKITGGRLSLTNNYSTASGALTGGQYYNILTVRNMLTYNGKMNYSELYPLSMNLALNSGSSVTKGGLFTFFGSAVLDNSNGLTWTPKNVYLSTLEYSVDIVPLISNGLELSTIAMTQNSTIFDRISDLEMYIPVGGLVTLAFMPFNDIAASPVDSVMNIIFNFSWIQR